MVQQEPRVVCTPLMIPRVLPTQQCGPILFRTVHELIALQVSKAHVSAIEGERIRKTTCWHPEQWL